MPVGSITQAIKLVVPGLSVGSSFTYYLAPSMPGYTSGQGVSYVTTSGGSTAYTYLTTDFAPITSSTYETIIGQAMTRMDHVSGVSFSYQSNTSAEIVIFGLTQQLYSGTSTLGAFTYSPGMVSNGLQYDVVVLPAGQGSDFDVIISHELMHSVGLLDVDQPGSTPDIYTGVEDSPRYTIMSYNNHPGEGRAATELQLYDIAALQSIYGRDDGFNASATTYSSFAESGGADRIFSIWDGGGEDKIDASALSNSVLIDLRPGYFSSLGANAAVSVTGGASPALTAAGTLNVSIA